MRSKSMDYCKKIEDFVNDYTKRCNRSPSVRDIRDGVGLGLGTVSSYLSYMRDSGMLDYSGCRNITTHEMAMRRGNTTPVPVLGRISCGIPKFAEENIEEYVPFPVSLCGSGEFFILYANGDSMVGAGIDDGDAVIVRRQCEAREGQIVVALIGEEATLKRYFPEPEGRRVRLHPENPAMEDIYADSCVIQGVAVQVLKELS